LHINKKQNLKKQETFTCPDIIWKSPALKEDPLFYHHKRCAITPWFKLNPCHRLMSRAMTTCHDFRRGTWSADECPLRHRCRRRARNKNQPQQNQLLNLRACMLCAVRSRISASGCAARSHTAHCSAAGRFFNDFRRWVRTTQSESEARVYATISHRQLRHRCVAAPPASSVREDFCLCVVFSRFVKHKTNGSSANFTATLVIKLVSS
jgi:hypothetical protein